MEPPSVLGWVVVAGALLMPLNPLLSIRLETICDENGQVNYKFDGFIDRIKIIYWKRVSATIRFIERSTD